MLVVIYFHIIVDIMSFEDIVSAEKIYNFIYIKELIKNEISEPTQFKQIIL